MLQHALGAAAAKAKIVGLVVAAAAVGSATAVVVAAPSVFAPAGDSSTVTVSTASPSSEPDETPASPATSAPSKAVSPADLPCPPDVKNHGTYVATLPSTGPGRGTTVSEAAHSDCGKPVHEGAADPAEKDDTDSAAHSDSANHDNGDEGKKPAPKKVRGKPQH